MIRKVQNLVTLQPATQVSQKSEPFILFDELYIPVNPEYILDTKEIDFKKFFTQEVLPNLELNTVDFSIQYRTIIESNIEIQDISDNGKEIKIKKISDIEKYFTEDTNQKVLYVENSAEINNRSIINNFSTDDENSYILLEKTIPDLSSSSIISIYILEQESDVVNLSLVENIQPKKTVTLQGKNYNPINKPNSQKSKNKKTLEEINNQFNTLTQEEFLDSLYSSFKTNYNFFENHVKFGSARAKVLNAKNKFETLRKNAQQINLYDWINTNIAWNLIYDKWSDNYDVFYNGNSRNLLQSPDTLTDETYWKKSPSVTVLDNQIISPDGTQNASTVDFSGGINEFFSQTYVGTKPNTMHTVEVWLKLESGTITPSSQISLDTDTIDEVNISSDITSQWKRFTYLTTSDSNGNIDVHIRSNQLDVTIGVWNYNLYVGMVTGTEISDVKNNVAFRKIKETFENFTTFENFLFKYYFIYLSSNNFDVFINNLLNSAIEFDLHNNNFLLYQVPEKLIENDSNQYLTNFILIYGEMFDQLWVDIKAISNENKYEYEVFEKVPRESLKDLLKFYGISTNINYNTENIANLFHGEQNLNKITEITSRRLLYTLPYLYKGKGTLQVVHEIINVFGVPRGIFDVVEIGDKTITTSTTKKVSEYEKYLSKSNNSTITVPLSNTDISETSVSFEFFVNNFSGEQDLKLVEFSNDTYISLVGNQDNNKKAIRVVTSGTTDFTTDYQISSSENMWTYIGLSINNGTCSIYTSKQDSSGSGVIRTFTDVQSINGSFGTYTDISILNSTERVSVSEFRVYNGVLQLQDFQNHADSIRSTYTVNNEDLLVRLNFKNNYDDVSGNNLTTVVTNQNENKFLLDEFFSFYNVNTVNGFNMETQTIYVDQQNPLVNLSNKNYQKDSTIIDSISGSDAIGIFLNPNEKINNFILSNFGNSFNYVPNDVDSAQFVVPNVVKTKMGSVSDTFKTYNYWFNILRFFNTKIFDLLSEFTRATTTLETGVILQNSILRVYKQKYTPTKLRIRKNVIGTDEIKQTTQSVSKRPSVVIDSIKPTTTTDTKNYFKMSLELKLKKGESVYLNNITTKQYSYDPFVKLIINNSRTIDALGTTTDIQLNAGAIIQVI